MDVNLIQFLNSFESDEAPIFKELEAYAVTNHVPIIKSQARKLLKSYALIHQPQRILEIGTAIGYSSLTLKAMCNQSQITTLERSPIMIEAAKKNFATIPELSQGINLIEGEALDYLEKIQEDSFDFIFLDSAKAQYITFLPYLLKGLRIGGLLITDNVLQEGSITKSRYAIPRRNRTIHQRMREYLWEISHNPQIDTVILPIDDGMAISVRK